MIARILRNVIRYFGEYEDILYGGHSTILSKKNVRTLHQTMSPYIARTQREYLKNIARTSHEHCANFARTWLEYYANIHEHCVNTYKNFRKIVRRFRKQCRKIVRRLNKNFATHCTSTCLIISQTFLLLIYSEKYILILPRTAYERSNTSLL